MRIFIVDAINLKVNKYKHTGFEVDLAQEIGKKGPQDFMGTFKAFVDVNDDDSTVIEVFRKEVSSYIRQIYDVHGITFKPEDWTYSLRYSEVNAHQFWMLPAVIGGGFRDLTVSGKRR